MVQQQLRQLETADPFTDDYYYVMVGVCVCVGVCLCVWTRHDSAAFLSPDPILSYGPFGIEIDSDADRLTIKITRVLLA